MKMLKPLRPVTNRIYAVGAIVFLIVYGIAFCIQQRYDNRSRYWIGETKGNVTISHEVTEAEWNARLKK